VIRAIVCSLLGAVRLIAAQPSAVELAHAIRDTGLDAGECYRVRDLNFAREDLRLYFNDGYLLFSKPVQGKRLWVIFSGEHEGGDAEVIVMPPHRSERRSLASFTGSPNLNEHFRSAFFVATDSTTSELLDRARQIGKQSSERGILLAQQYAEAARLLSESFTMRLVQDLLNDQRPESGLFFGTLGSNRLGNIDIMHDPASREQVLVGQVASPGGRPAFEVWCSFESRSVRQAPRRRPEPLSAPEYVIDTSLDSNLRLTVDARIKIRVKGQPMRALPFLISSRMRVTEAKLDGKPIEVFTRESIRENAIRGGQDDLFLMVAPEPVQPGADHTLEIRHAGDVIVPAGNNVFFVGSRGTWYPHQYFEYSKYDMTFRYPRALTLVGTGAVVEDKTEGDTRITRCVAESPIRFAGFNLGQYRKVTLEKDGYTIEVYGNRSVEPNLSTQGPNLIPSFPRNPRAPSATPAIPATSDSSVHLRELSEQIDGALEFMTDQFGPMPLKTLTVSPIPGFFGQGFPGLVYLSTFAYLSPDERAAKVKDKSLQTFFSDLLPAHELAHQWWGNLVTAESYPDEWVMESLANYSALLYLEKRKGSKALDQVLEDYRAHLITKRPDGKTVESSGPITWGSRLMAANGEDVWRTITYEKGSWIIHMLRRYMGDERFAKMLKELPRRYARQALTTEDFRRFAAEFLPPKSIDPALENFFETWVYGTGIPILKLDYAVRGKAPAVRVNGTLKQSEVEDEFSADVPVEIQVGKSGGTITKWVRSADDGASFSVAMKQAPSKVGIAMQSILAVRR
jgi:hypothetical protein